ncbi:CD4-2 molecule, tandem duplicate 2 [Mugil cephalus]|uniref:CD4-2 molecule, tandem duplicate 2 n=1 Tax=Mugil cephalus TaxID=48193 RepID=UPI001FB77D21|nr:CD4-2 molecule, tandem duplicate 2 [Mugil cephalus]XP_047454686.1 CD4-2 molecule, tandem duplicate 2 [Mugil cephalus]
MKTIVCFLFVLGALSAQGEVFHSKVGEKVLLKCGLNSYTRSLTWFYNDNKIVSVDKSGRPRKGSIDITERSKTLNTNLEISRVQKTDAGEFMCEVDGSSQHHTLLVVSVSVTPSAELWLGAKATLSCQVYPQDKGKDVQLESPDGRKHTGSNKELNPIASSDAGSWKCVFTWERKTFTESITIGVREPTTPTTTSNSKSSTKIPCDHCAKPGNSGQKPSGDFQLLGLKWWVWLSIGIGGLLVILLIIFVIKTCRTIKRRKRRFQMMKNAQHQMRSKNYCKCDRSTAAAKPQKGRRREKPSALPLKPLLV